MTPIDPAVLTPAMIDELERLEKAATPAHEQSMLQDRWIEWRGANGEKYSIAEFEFERDQGLYFALRNAAPMLLKAARELTALKSRSSPRSGRERKPMTPAETKAQAVVADLRDNGMTYTAAYIEDLTRELTALKSLAAEVAGELREHGYDTGRDGLNPGQCDDFADRLSPRKEKA